jgi:hypothetical protein
MIREIEALIRAYDAEVRAEMNLVSDMLTSIHYAAGARRQMLADLANAIDRAARATTGQPQAASPPPINEAQGGEPPPLPQSEYGPNGNGQAIQEELRRYPWQTHRDQ